MAEEQYSVELEMLLNDLQKRPTTALTRGDKILTERIQKLRAPERTIWFERFEEYRVEQMKKFHKLTHKSV